MSSSIRINPSANPAIGILENATTTSDGGMSAADKVKLNNITPSGGFTLTIAELRASDEYLSSTWIIISGYYLAGDGGGGSVYWDASSMAADDGGMVFKPTAISGGSPGRWRRPVTATIDTRWFGSKADNSTDLAPFINIASALVSAQGGGEVHVPDGDYAINTRIKLQAHTTVRLGRGNFRSHIEGPTWVFGNGWDGNNTHPSDVQSDIRVIGSGWDTVLFESDNLGNDPITNNSFMVIGVDGRNEDGTAQPYGDFEIRDLKIEGNGDDSTVSATNCTACLGDGNHCIWKNVWMKSTHALGLQLGNARVATGHSCENAWVIDSYFEDVLNQPVSAVNTVNCHVNRNKFKCGPTWIIGTLIDFELNSAADYAENFEICDNLIDARGTAQPPGAVFGIAILGQNPTLDLNHVGPGLIADNTVIGIQYPPDVVTDTMSMSNPINLAYTRDVKISGNNIRYSGPIYVQQSLRTVVSDNRFQDTGVPHVTVFNSFQTSILGNHFAHSNHFVSHLTGAISEIGSSDWTYVLGNTFDAPDGQDGGIYAGANIVLIGSHSRSSGNFFSGRPKYFFDYPDSRGWFELDSNLMSLRDMAAGKSIIHDSQALVAADRRTSDNTVSLYGALDAPVSFDTFSGATDVVGVEFYSTEPGYITQIRFYKHASDAASTHTWQLWSWGGSSISAILATGTFGTESASGWQTNTLSTPWALHPNQHYVLSYEVSASGAGYTTGALTSGRTSTPIVVPAHGGRKAGIPAPSAPGTPDDRSYFLDFVFQKGEIKSTNIVETKLTTTNATDVLDIANPQPGNYMLSAYYRVAGGASNITIVATWTDAVGAQSVTLATANGQAIGSYPVASVLINVAPGGGDLKITATAGTANRVYVSANAALL